jgi:hypothetical protein
MSESRRRVAFAIHTGQDLYLSAGFLRLLRRAGREVETIALVVADELVDPAGLLGEFDHVHRLGPCNYPRPLLALARLPRILRYRRRAKAVELGADDVLIAYSFREFALNVLIRALRTRPRLIAVRKGDADTERLLTRRRPLLSLYWNAWNLAFGATTQRYRWLPASDRIGSGTLRRDPYERMFTLVAPGAGDAVPGVVPYPFSLLPEDPPPDARPTLVFLGEKYPLQERQELARLTGTVNRILAGVRAAFPGHRLIFKARGSTAPLELDLSGYELAYEELLLEGLLIELPEVDTVLSFKSSGSFIAGLYGRVGVALYPLVDFTPDFRQTLDEYFEPYREVVAIVDDLGQLRALRPPEMASPERVLESARPFLDAVAPS